jgi:hypothetical protein
MTIAGGALSLNDAGGIGRYESVGGFAADVARMLQRRAQHFYVSGSLHVDNCTLLSSAGSEIKNAAPWQMVGETPAGAGLNSYATIVVADSLLRGSSPSQGSLTLHTGAKALVRGCVVHDLKFDDMPDSDRGVLAIVNSTLAPPLADALQIAMMQRLSTPPFFCAEEQIADHPMCDKRANCDPVASGGVQCSCVGKGLRAKAGTPDNGQQCEQDFSMHATLESESVAIAIAKPGSLANRTLTLIVEAQGEAELNVTFHVAMTRETSYGAPIPFNGSLSIDQPSISAFGQHLKWTQLPPAPMWRAELDGARLMFGDTTRHEFTVRLACDRGEHSCAADGDVITTVVQLASPQDSRLRSEVTVRTRVEALVSCNNTVAIITSAGLELESESFKAESPIEVRLSARDIDNLEVRFTRAVIELLWAAALDDETRTKPERVLFNAEPGTSEYTATLTAASTREPGRYSLSVRVVHPNGGSCELLRRSITATADKTQLIIGLVLSALVVVIGAVGGYLLFKSRERAKEFLLSFLSFEGTLAADIAMSLWDFAGT